jgi:hypothetical protein
MIAVSTRAREAIRKRLLGLLTALIVAWLLLLILVRIFEARLIFFPDYPDRLAGDWHPRGLPFQDVWLQTQDGIKLHAWWIPNDHAKFTFLAFHGNAGNIAGRADVYEFLHQLPANVLAIEFRGYGRSEGTPSEAGIYRDATAGFQYLVATKGIAPRTIISFGQSLGTAVAVQLAAEEKVGGVVLEAPFPSASAVARNKFWFLPGIGMVAGSQFDTRSKLRSIAIPIFIVHCTQDPVIPAELAEEVYAEAQSPKSILRVEGYCHEEACLIAPEKYRTSLQDFLRSLDSNSSQQ